eukprot:TRINITY_DN6672_c0_g1_i1.p1 TRINITY_DN6672_c0_g1~~TRINITY_DN6672_c0_g1_i1.p1  ORF type:complete len:171 (-),score=34.54 TRINITY_DN6672_c0_g1_i1:84-596(-)
MCIRDRYNDVLQEYMGIFQHDPEILSQEIKKQIFDMENQRLLCKNRLKEKIFEDQNIISKYIQSLINGDIINKVIKEQQQISKYSKKELQKIQEIETQISKYFSKAFSLHFLTQSKDKSLAFLQYLTTISCLLYTSDAADDMQCVDLGGRRIIKKKKIKNKSKKSGCTET